MKCRQCGFSRIVHIPIFDETSHICPQCGIPLQPISRAQYSLGEREERQEAGGKLNSGCVLLLFVIGSFIVVALCFGESQTAGTVALIVAVILQFVIMGCSKLFRN
jgi:hypothetical protein